MAEIIDLTEHIRRREEKKIDELSSRLADLIEDMGVKDDFQMYMELSEDMQLGMPPYVYTMYTPDISNYNYTDLSRVVSLADITDVLTKLTLQLDSMGYARWADKISDVVGEMFTSGSFKGTSQ